MPFKLKLKKTRQYNVASKSLFVLSVELLDGGVADCTLAVDSTGQECLDNVCQRQAINQPEFFGLRYLNHSHQPRWVQLDRPLKRQLDKYASSHQLYLRVMYYITAGMNLITDEVTRYHYFLQLKNDLVEGRIICDCQQAVLLASYSRQAEYGNHDRERHTVEYLKNLLMFPKQMIENGQIIESSTLAETGRLEWLTAAVIQQHMALHNMSQAQAEEGLISTCQQLRGYGQEQFAARAQPAGRELTVAVSLTGVAVLDHDQTSFYRWMDITNVINHKRTFKIECQRSAESASFVLPSPEDGKYVWRLCVLQHTFYMKRRGDAASHADQPVFQEHGLSESREELSCPAPPSAAPLSAAGRARSASCLELDRRPAGNSTGLVSSRALLPSYRAAPDYETAMLQKQSQALFPGSRAAAAPAPAPAPRHYLLPLQPELFVYKPPPPYPAPASTSTPDLAASQLYRLAAVGGSSPDLVSGRYLGVLRAGGLARGDLAALLERHEPIYENVPLPYDCRPRDRARSLSAADQAARRPPPAPALERLSLRDADDTPYTSLSPRREGSGGRGAHVTSVAVPDVAQTVIDVTLPDDHDSTTTNNTHNNNNNNNNNTTVSSNNTIYSTNTSKSSITSTKEKKRRRWGVFMGRGNKAEVKSASLGRPRSGPRAPPLPPGVSKETMCQLLERRMSTSELQFSFEQIPQSRAAPAPALPPPAPAPYDDNRVRLAPTPANPQGYINASHVTMTVGSTQRFYMVVQVGAGSDAGAGAGAGALWECAWQHGARVVVFAGDADRAPYLPDDNTTRDYGKMSVSVQAWCAGGWGRSSRVRLRRGGGGGGGTGTGGGGAGRVRELTHVTCYTHAQHDPKLMLEFLSEVHGVRLAAAAGGGGPLDARNAPLVFCGGGGGGGGGGAGVALAADLLLHTIDSNQELDIPRTLAQLHQQRAGLVCSLAQYRLLHQLLLLYLKQSRLI